MRIYTEVIFEWDDKQNKLVEISSDSFEYSGDMMLMQGEELDFWEIDLATLDPQDLSGKEQYDLAQKYGGSLVIGGKYYRYFRTNMRFFEGTFEDKSEFKTLTVKAPSSYDLSFISEISEGGTATTEEEALALFAEEYGVDVDTISDQFISGTGWAYYKGNVYEVEGNYYTTEDMQLEYGEDFNEADYIEGEGGTLIYNPDLIIPDEPETHDDAWLVWMDKYGPDDFFHGDYDRNPETGLWEYTAGGIEGEPDMYTDAWMDWKESRVEGDEGYEEGFNRLDYDYNKDTKLWDLRPHGEGEPERFTTEWMQWMDSLDADQQAAAGFPDFNSEDWNEVGDGYWELSVDDVEVEERTFMTADGKERTEQWMIDNWEDPITGERFDPEDISTWEQQLGPGKAYTRVGEDVPLGFGAQQSALIIEAAIADWAAITNEEIDDPFQDELEAALTAIGRSEQDVVRAFKEMDPMYGGALETLQDDWETEMDRLLGTTWIDPETDIEYTAEEAFDQELISEEEYLEIAGTYGAEKYGEEKEREEGLEGAVVSREEQLESLRKEARGEVRAAEAKIGAAGFAATGVGRTAREILAEEIGEEARDIEKGFTEEREDIKTGYTKDIAGIEKRKTTLMEDYTEKREGLAKAALKPWEEASREYGYLLQDYGAIEGEEGDYTLEGVIGGTEVAAEDELKNIQMELQNMISGIRLHEGYETYDPFADPETQFGIGGGMLTGIEGTTWADLLGWQPLGGTFSADAVTGQDLFRKTIEEKAYKPSTEFEITGLYDPEYKFAWEE